MDAALSQPATKNLDPRSQQVLTEIIRILGITDDLLGGFSTKLDQLSAKFFDVVDGPLTSSAVPVAVVFEPVRSIPQTSVTFRDASGNRLTLSFFGFKTLLELAPVGDLTGESIVKLRFEGITTEQESEKTWKVSCSRAFCDRGPKVPIEADIHDTLVVIRAMVAGILANKRLEF